MEFTIFLITAMIAVIGAVSMLLSKNAIHSALFLLLNFCAIAVLYLLLRAPFLFAVQLIVYAGAIIVLFLFVVMLMGAEKVEGEHADARWQRWAGLLMGGLLLAQTVYVFLVRTPVTAILPAPVAFDENFAAPEKIGAALFTSYLLPFELTGIVLLAAVIGVVVLTRAGQKG